MTLTHSVLLIEPPRTIYGTGETKRHGFPLGLGYLAATLERANCEVSVLDCVLEGFETEQDLGNNMFRYGLTDEDIVREIKRRRPTIVGISNLFSDQIQAVLQLCTLVKKTDPTIKTIIGGNHVTALPEQMLVDENVDIVVQGEGEYILRDIVSALNEGRDMDGLTGIGFRKNGGVVVNARRPQIEDLDELPLPARHLFPFERYFRITSTFGDSIWNVVSPSRNKKIGHVSTRYTNILTSRGCHARCIYCSSPVMWGHFRARSPQNVLSEMEHLIERYGIEEFHFQDNNITADIERAETIFRGMIDLGFQVHWTTPNGIALYKMTPALIGTMKESGCYSVWIAIESGSQKILNSIKKPLKLTIVKPLVEEFKRHHIRVSGFFLIGLPGETRDDIMQTIEFARDLELDYATFSITQPLPGTELFTMCLGDEGPVDFTNIKFARGDYTLSQLSASELEELRRYAWETVNAT